jgi:hypothetical protein
MVVGTATNAVIVGKGAALPEVTVTVTAPGVLVPPDPVQVRLYVYTPAVLRGPIEVPELDVGSEPVQPSEPVPPPAAQEVAPLVAHDSEVDCPVWIVVGFAAKLVTAAAAGLTVSVAVELELPAGPEQASVYE